VMIYTVWNLIIYAYKHKNRSLQNLLTLLLYL